MSRQQPGSRGQALAGAVLLSVGALLFAQNLNLLNLRQYWRYWPAILLMIGLSKLVTRGSRADTVFGLVLTMFGGAQLAKVLGYWSPGPPDIVAVTLMSVGAFFVFRGLFGRPAEPVRVDSQDWISAFAIMAGFERTNNSPTFRGGDLTAVMGGCEVDLRQASMRAPASLDVFVMWGGIEVRVPEDWTVELRGLPLLAGFVDKTRPPAVPTEKRLVVRGVALMGGIEIRN